MSFKNYEIIREKSNNLKPYAEICWTFLKDRENL